MKDKKLEENIKKAGHFIEIWNKFHDIFENATSREYVDESGEKEFLSTKTLVSSRYEDLMDSLGVKPLKRFIINPSLYNILSLDNLSIMSDEKLKTVGKDWNESCRFLTALQKRLESKKRRLKDFNKFAFVVKNKMRRK